jgi:hypothetical protein
MTPDSSLADFSPLSGGGWAWIPGDQTRIAVQPAGASSPRLIPIPPWYLRLTELDASPDGTRLAVLGWSAPSADSLGLTIITLPDGKELFRHVVFGEAAGAQWLDDGSILLDILPTAETYALERLRGPGQVERLGTIPRPLAGLSVSRDLKRMAVVGREHHGDAWTMKVVRR